MSISVYLSERPFSYSFNTKQIWMNAAWEPTHVMSKLAARIFLVPIDVDVLQA